MAYTHSLKDWSLTVGGVPIRGFGSEDAYEWEPMVSERFSVTVGADGEGVRNHIINGAGTVTIHLLSVSPSNDILQARRLLDELTGLGQFSILLKHSKSNTVVSADEAWINNKPGLKVATEVSNTVWLIASTDWVETRGGILVRV